MYDIAASDNQRWPIFGGDLDRGEYLLRLSRYPDKFGGLMDHHDQLALRAASRSCRT